jgi:shikimate kinase
MIRIVGPGGAGKTTVGLALANRLGVVFVDLDEQFTARVGDISAYLDANGYEAYASHNVHVYLELLASSDEEAVMALSSGFLTYHADVHPRYREIFRDIITSPSTVVLLPSFDDEACVAETVRRQLKRPFSRSAEREEQVIRARFGVYRDVPATKFETTKPVDAVVDDLVAHLSWVNSPGLGHASEPALTGE